MAVEASALAPDAPGFRAALEARLSPPARERLKKLRWMNRLTSAWAPVTVLGISFVVYLFIVELHTPAARWAQPAQQLFALLMVAWTAGIVVGRTAARPFARARKLRHQGWELVDEVARIVDRNRGALSPKAYEDVLASTAAAADAMAGDDLDKLERQLAESTAVADKQLVRWRKQSTFDFAMGFVKAFAIAMAIRTLLLEPFRIPSGSMIPTLQIGDQIFVNKFIYGVRIPFTNWVPFTIVRKPQRGDVIVFNNPVDESKDFIKRIAGIPGDRVEVIGEVLHINGVPQPRELVDADYTYWDQQYGNEWEERRAQLWREELAGKSHLTAQDPTRPALEREGPFVVPEGHVFVLGDNRDNSSDSRSGLGGPSSRVAYVPYGNIKGKAMVIWLALGHGGFLSGVFGGTGLRTDRLFLPVR